MIGPTGSLWVRHGETRALINTDESFFLPLRGPGVESWKMPQNKE